MWTGRPAKMDVGAVETVLHAKWSGENRIFLSADLALTLVMSRSARIGSLCDFGVPNWRQYRKTGIVFRTYTVECKE